MTLALPTDFPRQDYVLLDGAQSPGLIRSIKGTGPEQKWDERQGYGLTTGLVYTSLGLAKFTIEFIMWEEAQYAAWVIFAALKLRVPATGARPIAMKIGHPILNAPPHEITDVVVGGAVALPEQDEQGLWSVSVPFTQYRKPRPQFIVKPLEGPPGANTDVAPKSASEVQLAEMTKTFEALKR